MINIDTKETGNNTIIKFGGYDQGAIDTEDKYYG
jgi:hypothetical protein